MEPTSILSEIAQLIDNEVLGTFGQTLFIGHMVPTPDNVVMVFGSGGAQPEMYLDTEYANIDIWTRNTHSELAYDILQQIFTFLQRTDNIQLGRYYLYFLHATSNIIDMDRDAQTRKMYKMSFRAIYRDTQVVS